MLKRFHGRLLCLAILIIVAIVTRLLVWNSSLLGSVEPVLPTPTIANAPKVAQVRIVEADVAPGSSELKLVKSFASGVSGVKSSKEFARLVKRVVISRVVPSKTNYFSSQLTVFDPSNSKAAMNYLFAAAQSNDPGYIGFPHLSGKNDIVFAFGRYSEYDGFRLHRFDLRASVLSAFESDDMQNYDITYSPNGQFQTYTSDGFVEVSDVPIVPFSLYLRQSNIESSRKIYSGDYVYNSASWLPDNTLAYSHIEQKANAKIPVTYIYDPRQNKAHLWMNNCAAPKMSPDGRYVVFFGARDSHHDYTDNTHLEFSDSEQWKSNQALFIKSLKTGKVSRLRDQTIYDYEPKICWSSDSNSFLMAGENESSNLRMSLYKVGRTKPFWNSDIAIGERGQLSNIYSFKGKFLVQTMRFTSFTSPLDGEPTQDYRLFLLNDASHGWREIFSALDIKGLDLTG